MGGRIAQEVRHEKFAWVCREGVSGRMETSRRQRRVSDQMEVIQYYPSVIAEQQPLLKALPAHKT